jgi:hypothetical protein
MQPTQIDITDQYTDAATALRWVDTTRPAHELYLSNVEQALAHLRKRKDHGATWARPQFEAEAFAVQRELDRADACGAELEAAREAYRASCEKYGETQRAIDAATDVDVLLRAQAQLTLDGRAATAARAAFAAAAAKSKLPGFVRAYKLWRGLQLHRSSGDNKDVASVGGALLGYDRVGRNAFSAGSAHEIIHARNSTELCQLVWDVAGECDYDDVDFAEVAFSLRWECCARRHGLPFDSVVIPQPEAAE